MLHFVHSSDWHLPIALSETMGAGQLKQWLGRISWRFRRHRRHRREVFDAALRAWELLRPDRMCVTGDLINFAAPAEFAAAALELERIERTAPISLVPGNHDTLVAQGEIEQGRHWSRWLTENGKKPASWPEVRVHGPAVFIGLSSAIPTGPFLAQGAVAPEQLILLERLLVQFRKTEHFRVVMVHHPPQVGAAPWRRGLRNAQALRNVLGRAGAELVLHGHLHRRVRGSITGADGPIPVFGAGSSSLAVVNGHSTRGHFHRFALGEPRKGRWPLEVTDYFHDAARGEFGVGLPDKPFPASPDKGSLVAAPVFARVDLIAPRSVPALPR